MAQGEMAHPVRISFVALSNVPSASHYIFSDIGRRETAIVGIAHLLVYSIGQRVA
jgi:hypothetical protein